MIPTSFVAIAFAVLLGITAAAPTMDNDVRIERYGWSNSAGGAQEWNCNRIISHQYDRNSLSAGGQEGADNYGATYQTGDRNVAGIGKFGADHTAILTQDGMARSRVACRLSVVAAPISTKAETAMLQPSCKPAMSLSKR